jgi:STE24 endopeptidase
VPHRARNAALVLGGLAAWIVAAAWLWRSTTVPGDLSLPRLDEHDVFAAGALREARSYESGALWIAIGALASQLAVLGVMVWRAPTIARGIGIGPIGAGIVLGLVTMVVTWAAGVPFTVLDTWWARRYGLSDQGYAEAVLAPWAELAGRTVTALVVIVIVMWLARRIGRLWWLAGAPAFAVIAAAFAFLLPYLLTVGADRVSEPRLESAIPGLERRTGAGPTPVFVETVSDWTNVPNAYTVGFGPSERVVLWDTLVDGRFTEREVEAVVAHEFGHVARDHVWKGLAWFLLLALPGLFVVAEVTRLRGGMGLPQNVPLAALVLVCVELCLAPTSNAVSRHFEQEADWIALAATRDPDSVESLFTAFTEGSLADPTPPSWSQALFGSHPSTLERIEMARAWAGKAGG